MPFTLVELNRNRLPTNRDVIQHLLFLRSRKKNRRFGLSKFYSCAINDIAKVWQNAHIPIINRPSIRKKIVCLTKRYRDNIKNRLHFKEDEWNELFLISSCKCVRKVKVPCECPVERRMSLSVWKFYVDQSGERLLSLDDEPYADSSSGGSDCLMETDSTCSEEEFTRQDYLESSSCEENEIPKEHRTVADISLPTFSAALDRAGVSDRFGALLATTLLKDLNIQDIILDQHKIRRERGKARLKALNAIKCNDLLKCISFDGKRERTLKQKFVNGEPRNIKAIEEHITIIKEPNSSYIGYFAPGDGRGIGIAMGIINFLKAEGISLEYLVAINCDGTSCNTGKFNGAICSLERQLKRPLQWLVCLFHFNELPFTALLKKLLGNASGPQNWPGVIGKTLVNCEEIPVADNFEPIEMGEMPENIDGWRLRGDQKYLYEMVRAVDRGVCDDTLANLKPGPLNLSRWLTTASRVLRLYVTETVSSENLKNLAVFVMKVYAPFWFLVKSQPQAINGSRHLFKYIKWIRQLPEHMQVIVQRSVQINGFFAHPENIILSMITDERKDIRREAYDIIFQSRERVMQQIRQFTVPKINFNCDSLKNMVNWNEVKTGIEPPCIQFYSQEYLLDLQNSDEIINIPEFPCHSQSTERFVHVVSQSAASVIDKNRPAYIASQIVSRKQYTKIESRKDLM